MAKLVEATISRIAVPAGKREVLVFDDALPGFGVRKFASGKASFFVKYQIGEQQRKITLGAVVPGVLADMRRRASDVLARAKIGQDVAAEKQAARIKKTASVGELVSRYLEVRQGDLRQTTFTEWTRYLSRYWAPLHGLGIEAVMRRDIVSQLDKISAEHGKVSADRAKTALSSFFAWAIDQSYLDMTPVQHIKKRNTNGSRDRVLTEIELAAVWRACDGESDHGRIVRLLILTAQRREEMGGLRWAEINFDKRQIELPAGRTKNKRPHLVPLSDPALAILAATPHRHGRDLVFGEGEGGYSGWSRSKARLDGRLGNAVAPWTLHDLRRTGITLLGENGFALPHVVEMLVNHVSGHKGGVAGIYDKAKYLPERRRALELWGEHVMTLVEFRPQDAIGQ